MAKRLMVAAVCGSLLALAGGSVQAELAVGDEAPKFELVGSDGKTYTNADFNGKQVIVIAWYPKAFTGGCTKECKSLRESGDQLREFDVAYFTASVDSVQKNTDFAKSLKLDYPILSDPTKKVAEAFGCLSPRGFSSRWTYYIGKDNKILHIEKKVATGSHGEQIAKKLAELGVAKKSKKD